MKKIISSVIATIMLTSVVGAINTVAEENEQYDYFIKLEESNAETIEPYSINGMKLLDVPFCEQEEGNFCGPACVQQIAKYYGYNTSQSKIAESLKTKENGETFVSDIVNYCNNHFPHSWNEYDKDDHYKSASNMLGTISNSLNCDKPVIANLFNLTTSNWLYNSNGHYVVCRGYVDDTATNGHVIYIVDPWKKGHGISNGRYTVSSEKLYNVAGNLIG